MSDSPSEIELLEDAARNLNQAVRHVDLDKDREAVPILIDEARACLDRWEDLHE